MPRIYVEYAGMDKLCLDLKEIRGRVNAIEKSFKHTVGKLDWDVKFDEDINTTGKNIAKKLNKYEDTMSDYYKFISNAYDSYLKLDNVGTKDSFRDFNSLVQQSGKQNVFGAAEGIFGLFETLNSKGAGGFIKDAVGFLESYHKIISGNWKEATGAEAVLDLFSNGIGTWTEMYDYLKEKYDGEGSIFSKERIEEVGWLKFVGDAADTGKEWVNMVETIRNSAEKDIFTIGSEVMDVIDSAADIVYDAMDITDENPVTTAIKSTAAGIIGTIDQVFDSCKEYMADGTFDLKDLSSTLIDCSTNGLYEMVSKATHGFISEESTGVSADDISNAIKNISVNIGEKAGNYIVAHQDLLEKYRNSNVLGKMFIMYSSAFKAC